MYFRRYFTKQQECIAPLLYIIANAPEVNLRQISAVLLKRHIIVLFDSLSDSNKKEEIKRILLEQYFKEPSKPVRESIGRVISYIMSTISVKTDGWKQLIAEIDQKTMTNSNLQDKEKGIALISYISEMTTNEINNNYQKYLQFFLAHLRDPERIVFFIFFKYIIICFFIKIRVQTLKTLLSLFESFDKNQTKTVDIFKNILQTMLQVLSIFTYI